MNREEIAKELFKVFNGTKTESIYDNKTRWIGVAKEVERLILEARIQELTAGITSPEWAKRNRIDALTAQLEKLK